MATITLNLSGLAAMNAAGGQTSGLAGAQQAQFSAYAAHKAALAAAAGAPPPAIAQLSAADVAAKQAAAAAHDAVMGANGGDYTNANAVNAAETAAQLVGQTAVNHLAAHGVSTVPGTGLNASPIKVPDVHLTIDTDTGAITSAVLAPSSMIGKVATALGLGAAGAMLGGPVGLALGLTGGIGIDLLRAKTKSA